VGVPAEYVELCGVEKDCFVEEFVGGGREFVTQVMDAGKIYGLVDLSVEEEWAMLNTCEKLGFFFKMVQGTVYWLVRKSERTSHTNILD